MILRLANLIHPIHIFSGSKYSSVPVVTAARRRTFNRNQLSLPLLLRSPEIGLNRHLYCQESDQSFRVLSGFHSRNSLDDFHTQNATNKSSNASHNIYSDPMRIGSGNSNRSCYHGSFQGIGVLSLIAAKFSSTVSATCCWSAWILILLGAARNTQKGRNLSHLYRPHSWRRGILPTATTAAVLSTSMSRYSMVFANSFHPSVSCSSEDQEKDDDKSKNGNGDDNQESSSSSAEGSRGKETYSLLETTCDANKKVTGKPHPVDNRLVLFHFDSTTSTQDEAKTIAKGLSEASSPPDTFCVTATSQSNGRGTTGRQWLGAPGNVFVTIGIPVDVWMTKLMKERRIPLTLLPLKIGELTASLINSELEKCNAADATVTVKWPNDVLVDEKKISGTLIENASNWFLIGIGINVAHAPTVSTTGTDYGRPSVSLHDYCGDSKRHGSDQKARDLGVGIALSFHKWIYEDNSETAEMIVEGWKRWLNWDAELTMRNDTNRDEPRRVVKLLDVLPDGRIKVANKGDGKEEILVSDYFV